MNKIKILISLAVVTVIVGLISLSNTGCSTTGGGLINVNTNGILVIDGNSINTNDVYTGIEIATQLGVSQAIKSDTNSIQYFKGVYLALGVLLDNNTFDPADLTNTLNSVNISQLKNPNTIAFMEAGVSLYEGFYGTLVSGNIQNANIYLSPALNGLQVGISNALVQVNATP